MEKIELACHKCEELGPRIEEIRTSGHDGESLWKCGNCGTILHKGTEAELFDKMEQTGKRLAAKDEHITLDQYE